MGALVGVDPIHLEYVAVNAVLDKLHATASKGQLDEYLSCFAEGAVFVGTDATERWTIFEFGEKCKKIFRNGKGWTYISFNREVYVANNIAWFYEQLKNRKYGETRGSGVLEKIGGVWRIGQYVLSFPVPNALCDTLARQVRETRMLREAAQAQKKRNK